MRVRLALLVILLALVATPASAQIGAGIKAGFDVTDLSYESTGIVPCCAIKTGFAVGGFVDVPVADLLSFQPEVLYVTKGGKSSEPVGGVERTFNVNYIDIPLLLKVSPPSDGNVRAILFVGPVIGIKAGDATITVDGDELDDDGEFDSGIDSSDVGVALGGGAQIGRFSIEARFNLGLTDVDKGDDKVKNRVFLLLGGVRFGP